MKSFKLIYVVLGILALIMTAGIRWGYAANASEAKPRVIECAFASTLQPYGYVDTDGKIKGYEIDILRKIDELLPEYEFNFNPVDYEAETIGVQAGTYQIGSGNHYYSEARAANYLLADVTNYTKLILVIREDDNVTKGLRDLDGKTIAPIPAGNALFIILQNFLKENPDVKITCENAASGSSSDGYRGVADGRYDASFGPEAPFLATESELNLPVKAVGPVDYVASFFLLNKNEEELLKKVNGAIAKLTAEGWISELSKQYYGFDVFADYASIHPQYNVK
jgi:L-cystine transport system substrate-binding protein